MRLLYRHPCFFFNDTATTQIYTLSLHDALPISTSSWASSSMTCAGPGGTCWTSSARSTSGDRKSTRLNSSHSQISYAVFCLKKKKNPTFYVFCHAEEIHVPKMQSLVTRNSTRLR